MVPAVHKIIPGAVLQRIVESRIPLVDQHGNADCGKLQTTNASQKETAGSAIFGTEIRDSELPDGSEERGYSAQERSRKTLAHLALSVMNAWKARDLHDVANDGEDGGRVISVPPVRFAQRT